MSTYSYDRTAAEKVWHDIRAEAQTKYVVAALKGVAKALKGKGQFKPGSFGSANGSVKVGKETIDLKMGFIGGSTGKVYIEISGQRQYKGQIQRQYKDEIVITSHTPTSFGIYVSNMLKREGWQL